MKRHIISQPAIKDLEEIIDYFSSRNIEAGERFINDFENKCKYLANFPNMGRSYDDIKPSLRGLPLASYIIFYRIIDDGIEIIRVVSGYRDLESLFLSDRPPRVYSVADYAKTAIALLDELGIKKTSIFGSLTGGYIAGEVAAAYPERVEKLIFSQS